MVRASSLQLFALIVLFEIGSSPLFLLAGEAKQDAWIAVAVAMLCGLGILLFILLPIQRQEPGKNLVEICQLYLGTVPGRLLAGVFVVYYMYSSMRNVREMGDLTLLYLLPNTPLSVVMLIMVSITAYVAYKGVEVFFRVAEYLLPLVVVVYAMMFGAFAYTGLMKLERLTPVLHKSFFSVAAEGIPEVISFPFGEVAVFLMFWKYLSNRERLVPISAAAYCLAGIFITWTTVLLIAVLGPLAGVGGIPMMMAASLVHISRFLERMDPLVALLLFTGVIMKQTTYFLAAVLALSTMTGMTVRRLVFPLAALLYVISFSYRSLMQHVWVGFAYDIKYHFPYTTIYLPVFLWLIMKIRRKKADKA